MVFLPPKPESSDSSPEHVHLVYDLPHQRGAEEKVSTSVRQPLDTRVLCSDRARPRIQRPGAGDNSYPRPRDGRVGDPHSLHKRGQVLAGRYGQDRHACCGLCENDDPGKKLQRALFPGSYPQPRGSYGAAWSGSRRHRNQTRLCHRRQWLLELQQMQDTEREPSGASSPRRC